MYHPPSLLLLLAPVAVTWQVGAIIADIVFGYVDHRTTFLLSAAFGLVGWVFGWLFLPDTTGLSLDELDRWVCLGHTPLL